LPSTVIFDADCGVCQRTRRAIEMLDWFGAMRWLPQQDAAALEFGIPRDALEKSMYLITRRGRAYRGFDAVQQILLRLPVSYAVAALAIRKAPVLAAALAFFFSPVFKPAGDRAYTWIASNRYRLPGSTCAHTNAP
jgi:predicted DCC family thiol-disulfide oxidoreductase YuxK